MFKSKSKVFFLVSLLIIASLAVFAGCGKKDANKSSDNKANETKLTGTVKASGSSALLPLIQKAKEDFELANAGVTISPTAGGSFTGLKQVSEGAVDIGNSDIDAAKAKDLKDAAKLVDHKVVVAPFVIVVNAEVKTDSLTQEQLVKIFTGKIKNWKEVGGQDLAITVVHRPPSSGSRAVIKEIVMKGEEFPALGVQQDSSGSVKQTLESTKGSIGYLDVAYTKNDTKIKTLKYNGVAYSPENVYSAKYPVWAYEHMYTNGEAKGAVKAFIDFIMSKDFQNTNLDKLGFLPVDKVK